MKSVSPAPIVALPDHNQPVLIGNRKRAQHERMHHRADSGEGAYRNGQDRDGDHGEAGVAAK